MVERIDRDEMVADGILLVVNRFVAAVGIALRWILLFFSHTVNIARLLFICAADIDPSVWIALQDFTNATARTLCSAFHGPLVMTSAGWVGLQWVFNVGVRAMGNNG